MPASPRIPIVRVLRTPHAHAAEMRILYPLSLLFLAAAPAAAQVVEVRAGDAIVNAARVEARTDTFAMAFESGGAALLVIRTATGGDAAAPFLLRVERISTLEGREVSTDSFAARRPTLVPVFDVQRERRGTRTLTFPPGAVTGKTETGGVRTPVNATLDPPAFYMNTTDLLLASLPLEERREFSLAMWDPDHGAYTLRLHAAEAVATRTVDGGSCDAWKVRAEDRNGASTYWVERRTRALLAYTTEGLELRIVHHPACPAQAAGLRESR